MSDVSNTLCTLRKTRQSIEDYRLQNSDRSCFRKWVDSTTDMNAAQLSLPESVLSQNLNFDGELCLVMSRPISYTSE